MPTFLAVQRSYRIPRSATPCVWKAVPVLPNQCSETPSISRSQAERHDVLEMSFADQHIVRRPVQELDALQPMHSAAHAVPVRQSLVADVLPGVPGREEEGPAHLVLVGQAVGRRVGAAVEEIVRGAVRVVPGVETAGMGVDEVQGVRFVLDADLFQGLVAHLLVFCQRCPDVGQPAVAAHQHAGMSADLFPIADVVGGRRRHPLRPDVRILVRIVLRKLAVVQNVVAADGRLVALAVIADRQPRPSEREVRVARRTARSPVLVGLAPDGPASQHQNHAVAFGHLVHGRLGGVECPQRRLGTQPVLAVIPVIGVDVQDQRRILRGANWLRRPRHEQQRVQGHSQTEDRHRRQPLAVPFLTRKCNSRWHRILLFHVAEKSSIFPRPEPIRATHGPARQVRPNSCKTHALDFQVALASWKLTPRRLEAPATAKRLISNRRWRCFRPTHGEGAPGPLRQSSGLRQRPVAPPGRRPRPSPCTGP